MNDLDQFKKLLGTAAKGYNEVQIRQLHLDMHRLAELLIEIHSQRERHRKGTGQSHRQVDKTETAN